MKVTPRWRLFALLVILVVAADLLVKKRFFPQPLLSGITTSGGKPLDVRLETVPYLQWDPKWADDKLGTTTARMSSEGCTLCSLAMALTSQGFPVTPPDLNALLTKNGGFTDSGLIIWKSLQQASNGRFSIRVVDRPDHELLDQQLEAKNPLLAKVLYKNSIWHWVLITGKKNLDYLIQDPLGSGTPFETMTNFPRGIYAVRYLERH